MRRVGPEQELLEQFGNQIREQPRVRSAMVAQQKHRVALYAAGFCVLVQEQVGRQVIHRVAAVRRHGRFQAL